MRVRMADAGGANANQHIARPNTRSTDLPLLQRRAEIDEADCFHSVAVALWATSTNISRVAQRRGYRSYPNFTKYFPGNCFTSFFNSSRKRVDETVPLGSSAFAAISSICVSVSLIAS